MIFPSGRQWTVAGGGSESRVPHATRIGLLTADSEEERACLKLGEKKERSVVPTACNTEVDREEASERVDPEWL